MKISKNTSAKEIILKMVSIPKDDIDEFDIGTPSVLGGVVSIDSGDVNTGIVPDTKVVISAKSDSTSYKGSKEIQYRRINLQNQWTLLFGKTRLNWKYNQKMIPELTEENVKKHINNILYHVDSEISYEFTKINDEQAKITLDAINNSLLYTTDGNKIEINLEYVRRKQDISSIHLNDDNTFEYETVVEIPEVTLEAFTV